MALEFTTLRGPEAQPYVEELAGLRIRIFREFPYLYEGDLEYETTYLDRYLGCSSSVIVLALDHGRIAGASTGLPLAEADPDFQSPLLAKAIPLDQVFYFGESVLEARYRGQGVGHRFFDLRESAALDWGARTTCFCAVDREEDHPLKPRDYRPHDAFWTKRGYRRQPDLKCVFSWRESPSQEEKPHRLTFWLKHWRP